MATALSLDTSRTGGGDLVLTAIGELDLSNIESFTQALAADVAEASGRDEMLTVDLRGIDYLDSTAVNALFAHAERIIVLANPFLVRVFDISGLTELATVKSTSS
ncbi:STAS domain-containing protein [Mycobacterium paraterrae]|uniref:STAS domain-containing protein n=1 Tax=Mycobacterium paraterrae TaxID=577492 RepID=A0ABY3VEC9_9MYCO|nr:STAS domain-containing protein [Mycobacterium paraterrae]UMB67779.1 STAS domain-containing protein [Mycobacterium paraterrae]